jgi:lipid-binding SYLF domain-containing protein
MKAFYGSEVSTRAVLTGQVPAPPASMAFLDAVRAARHQAHEAEVQ